MPSVTVDMDPITAQAAQAFDYPFDGRTTFDTPTIPQLPETYKIGLIVGPSGSGKTLLLDTFGKPAHHDWNSNKSLCSYFETYTDALNKLSAVGLNSLPTWVKPFHTLSTGERARATIARSLHHDSVFDEFTSTVDRSTARSLAASLRSYVDTSDTHSLIFASCHRDIIPWLDPDWTFDTLSKTLHVGRSPQPRSIIIHAARCDWHCWRNFSPHHYLTHSIHKGAQCFLGTWLEAPVVFTAVLALPHPKIKNSFREHRTVCLPEHQGLGIGTIFVDTIAELFHRQGKRFYSRTIHPRVGQHREKSHLWTPTPGNLKKQQPNKTLTQISDHWTTDTLRTCYSHRYTG